MIECLLDVGEGLFLSNPTQDIGDISNQKPSSIIDEGSDQFNGIFSDFGEGIADHPPRL